MRCTGEYGELLLSSEAGLQPGEEPTSVSSTELVQTLETVLSRPTISPVGREYALTALMKLSTRLPDHSQGIQVGTQLGCLVLTRPLTAIEISVCQAYICLGCSQLGSWQHMHSRYRLGKAQITHSNLDLRSCLPWQQCAKSMYCMSLVFACGSYI